MRYLSFLLTLLLWTSCSDTTAEKESKQNELIVFAEKNISIPMKEMVRLFEQSNPDIKVKIEFMDSQVSIHKLDDSQNNCDILITVGSSSLEQKIIPKYAKWNINFANDEIAIGYKKDSRFSSEINTQNWLDILQKEEVKIGQLDPIAPCGYQTVLALKLAEGFYKEPNLIASILQKDQNLSVSHKSDLLNLLTSGKVDYIFTYKSMIKQNRLKAIYLPDSINLKYGSLSTHYKNIETVISDKRTGKSLLVKGEPIGYKISLLKEAPHSEAAIQFVQFVLGEKGRIVTQAKGLMSTIPNPSPYFDNIPEILQPFARPIE